jgi:catechol 2,3-dioxygenase-like lactoylglutathione lyase family enzyme
MARIKHIAIRTADPERTAAFYREVFDLEQVGAGRSGIYLSDGYINLAILKPHEGTLESGIEHLGFQVDDLEATLAKLERAGGALLGEPEKRPPADPSAPQSYFEVKCLGPDRQLIDVSSAGWVGTDTAKLR